MASLESQLKAYASGTGKFKGSGGDLNYQLMSLAKKAGYDEEYFKKRDEEERLRRAAEEEAKKAQEEQSGDKRGFLQKAFDQVNPLDSGRSFETAQPSQEMAQRSGIDQLKDVGRELGSSYDYLGQGLAEVASDTFGMGDQGGQESQQQLLDQNTQLINNLSRVINDPNESKEKKDRARKVVEALRLDIGETAQEAAGRAQQVQERTDPIKGGAAVASVGLDVLTAGALAKGGSMLSKVAEPAIAGGLGGGFGAVQEQGADTTITDIAQGVGIGAAAGAVLGGVAGGLEDWVAKRKIARASFDNGAMPGLDANPRVVDNLVAEDQFAKSLTEGKITDPARLLPDGSASKAARLAEIDTELDQLRLGRTDPNVYASSLDETTALAGEPAGNAKLTQGGAVDQRSSKTTGVFAEDTGKTLADSKSTANRARELMKERKALEAEIDKIQNPTNQTAEQYILAESDLQRAQASGSPQQIKQATQNLDYMEEEAQRVANLEASEAVLDIKPTGQVSRMTTPDGSMSQPMAARRTEALAIERKLADGFDIEATPNMNMAEQADLGTALYRTNKDAAVQMAMGEINPPGNIQASTMYKVVEDFATKENDWKTLKRLAEESTIPGQGKAYGQYNAAFAYKSPTSALDAMQDVMQSRKKVGGIGELTDMESQKITELSGAVTKAKDNYLLNKTDPESRRLYGDAVIAYDNYKADLIASANPKLKDALRTSGFYKESGNKLLGLPKSIVASLDNSALLRQGWKTLWTNPKTWAKNSAQSFADMARTYGGKEVMDSVHSDIVSRENMVNGLYKKAGLDVYGAKKDFLEEAFPTSFQKVTNNKVANVAKRPFKASEVAYSAWQQRTRADLFDYYIGDFANKGGNVNSAKEVKAIGQMVNALTGRGTLPGNAERAASTLNKLFFAPRLVKSHIDVLGGHVITGAGGSNYVRKRAARNLVQIAIGSATTLAVTSAALGGKIELDPRSSDFGKLRIGDTRFDLSGGMAGLLTLGARMLTQSSKSANTGEVKDLNTGEFGSRTTLSVLGDFASNKLSPIARVITDQMEGKNFEGEKPTIGSVVKSLTMPLIIQQYSELKDSKNAANTAATLIAEGLGIGSNTYGLESNWNANNSKQITQFKKQVSSESFKKAEDKFNTDFQDWYSAASANDNFWKLPMKSRESLVTTKKNQLTKEALATYGFKYKTETTDDQTKQLIESLKNL